jgi:UPF0271 protein
MRPLLNIDAGELPDEPEELYALAHLVNVACGGHAGDDASMDRVILACARTRTRVGAHPSYADREGFGRRALDVAPETIRASVAEQCARLRARAEHAGATVSYAKPHGALYHAANGEPAIARAVVEGAVRALGEGVVLVGPSKGELHRAAAAAGCGYLRERFADRGVRPDGTLIPRGEPGALVADPKEAAKRALTIARDGDADTICVHGDTPGAIAIARAVRLALDGLR